MYFCVVPKRWLKVFTALTYSLIVCFIYVSFTCLTFSIYYKFNIKIDISYFFQKIWQNKKKNSIGSLNSMHGFCAYVYFNCFLQLCTRFICAVSLGCWRGRRWRGWEERKIRRSTWASNFWNGFFHWTLPNYGRVLTCCLDISPVFFLYFLDLVTSMIYVTILFS